MDCLANMSTKIQISSCWGMELGEAPLFQGPVIGKFSYSHHIDELSYISIKGENSWILIESLTSGLLCELFVLYPYQILIVGFLNYFIIYILHKQTATTEEKQKIYVSRRKLIHTFITQK